MSDKIKILWADDEIDMLKPQLFFLEKKGYDVVTVSNGHDALDVLDEDTTIDIFGEPKITRMRDDKYLGKFFQKEVDRAVS